MGGDLLVPIVRYSSSQVAGILRNAEEISQEYNYNSNARLFVVNGRSVFKMFLNHINDCRANIDNLLLLREVEALNGMKGLVLPTQIVEVDDSIIGYFMPYINGCTLQQLLMDQGISRKRMQKIFAKLASVVSSLPEGVCVGDLHANNVIVDLQDDIHLIDLDGFTLKWGHQLSVPPILPDIYIRNHKYRHRKSHIISRNSDIFCVYYLFMSFLFEGIDILNSCHTKQCIDYIRETSGGEILARGLSRLYEADDNILHPDLILSINIDDISYQDFLQKMELIDETNEAVQILREYIRR